MRQRLVIPSALALAVCGCLASRPNSGEVAQTAPPADATSGMIPASVVVPEPRLASTAATKNASELPPGLAAKACLKTAEELEARGFEAEAIVEYERARELDPKTTRVAVRLATLYARNGGDARAAAEFEKALKTAPNNADLLNDLGYFHAERGDWAAAEKALGQAVRVKPDHARACVNLAVVYAKTGRIDESRKGFARVLTPAQTEYNLGVVLAGAGRASDAVACFRAALQQDAGFAQAHDALRRIHTEPSLDSQPVTAVSALRQNQP